MNEDDTIDDLVGAANGGDRDALQQLLAIIRPLVIRYCRPRISSDRAGETADDLAQEICLAVLTALPTYPGQGRPFLPFVYGIAAHKVLDAHRNAGRDPATSTPTVRYLRDGSEQAAADPFESAGMHELLELLPPKQREILLLRVVFDLSAEEVSEATGSTPGAVRVAQHRALTQLYQLLTEPNQDQPATASQPTDRDSAEGAAPRPVLDWNAAPRTGDLILDGLFEIADAHLSEAIRAQ